MRQLVVLMIPVALAVGCASPAPVAENFPLSHQKVARTAKHWDVVADDVVAQTMGALDGNGSLKGRPLYVAVPEVHTPFNRAFREFLITRLVAGGASVDVCRSFQQAKEGFAADGAQIELKYDAQLVRHGTYFPDYEPRRYTWLAAGVAVIHRLSELHLNSAESVGLGLAGGAFADWWLGRDAAPTRTEIVVTTTVADANRFVMRRNDIYYVPDGDADLFARWGRTPKTSCPEEEADAGRRATADDEGVENSRRALVVREMRRVNPAWRAPAEGY